jgi:hypothetical protein
MQTAFPSASTAWSVRLPKKERRALFAAEDSSGKLPEGVTRELVTSKTLEDKGMSVLSINNGRDRTAYTYVERSENGGYFGLSNFLDGNITEEIKELCRRFEPEQIILQLPPTGLDKKTQKAIQEGFGRNMATAFGLGRYPVIKNLIRTRAAFGCSKREEARKVFGRKLNADYLRRLPRRDQMQLINTVTLAYDSVEAAEQHIS